MIRWWIQKLLFANKFFPWIWHLVNTLNKLHILYIDMAFL